MVPLILLTNSLMFPPSFPAFWADRTPVHEAARRGELAQLRQLIESGACVNAVTYDSITPLHEASLRGQAQCVQLLLDAGAQTVPWGRNSRFWPLLGSRIPIFPCLFPFFPAGSPECVRLLIAVGANLEAHDCHFGTPLHVACAREHLDCAKLLLQIPFSPAALHHAAKVRNVDLVEMLVEFGGNIYARDNRGKKPSDYTWSSSPTAKCIEYYEKTPLSLAQLCRVTVRRAAAARRGLAEISKLQIPPRLIEYLSYN
uniref:Ankyrin repeat and SOCS box containing 13 n=1 Tax=Cyanoderma ruficeps TaxID=181631 RepID=A0A8C3QLR7_9PASS